MKLLLATTLLLCLIAAVLSQECPCAKEIGKACRQPSAGPDFDNDRNWEYVGLVDFMTEKELADLPNQEPPTQPRELPPYDIELERAVAISPEGKKYIWRGPLPSREEAEPDWAHVGGSVSTMPPTATLPQEGAVCFPFSEQPDGRTRLTGNGLVLFKSDGFEVVSTSYTNIGGTVSPFAAGGVEMVAGVMKIHHAVSFRVLDPTIRAIVVTGLSAIDDLVVNMQITTTGGISSTLHVGSFPANFAASSGFEVRVLDSSAKSFAFISHNGPIASLIFGHVQIATNLCGYDSIPPQWYDYPLAGTTTTTATTRPGRSVYGTDTRSRDTPTTGYPRRVFGAIHSPTGNVHYCSGAKIGPRHFLTAGHCMFSKNTKKWIPNARIWFGQNGDGAALPPPASQAPFGIARHSWYYSTVGWVDNQDWRYDYGMIVLQDRPETVSLGWLGYSSKSYHSEVGKAVNLHGHPGSGATCSASPRADKLCAGFMYGDLGGVKDRSSYHLYYGIDTNPGNSGSSVYDYNGGNRVVVGVHAYGDNGDSLNKAVRIRNEVFDNLKSWKNQWPSQFD